jgi:hypothetical protein
MKTLKGGCGKYATARTIDGAMFLLMHGLRALLNAVESDRLRSPNQYCREREFELHESE